jgi:hypothetical protein
MVDENVEVFTFAKSAGYGWLDVGETYASVNSSIMASAQRGV